MAKIWRNRIVAGTQKYEDCPDRYKSDVLELLKLDVANGTITAKKFKELTGIAYA